MTVMPRLVSLAILVLLIVALGIMFFQVVAPFLLPLFLAGVLAVLCQPVFGYFVRKTNGRTQVAAGLTTATVLAVILVPVLVGTFIGSVQLYVFAEETLAGRTWNDLLTSVLQKLNVERLVEQLNPYLADDLNAEQLRGQVQANLKSILTALAQRSMGFAAGALGFLGTAVSAIISLLMFVIALYYFLADGPAMIAGMEGLVPLHADYQRQVLRQFETVVRSVVMATFLAAIGQGLATSIALLFVGFDHFFLLSIVCMLAALVPLAGTWLIWGPCAVWLFLQGSWVSAVFLVLYGTIFIGLLDNAIRTYILQSDTKLHPLLAFISVLGGLQVIGLWGVFIGPIVACCLHALIQIFNTELQAFSQERVITSQPASAPSQIGDGQQKHFAPSSPTAAASGTTPPQHEDSAAPPSSGDSS